MKKIIVGLLLLSAPIYATVDPGDNPAMYAAIDRIETWAQNNHLDVSLGHQGKGNSTDPWFVNFVREDDKGNTFWEVSGCDSLDIAEPVAENAVGNDPAGYKTTVCR